MFNEESMPCPCPECGEWIDLNDMVSSGGKLSYHTLVCQDCYDELESDDD